MSSATIVEAPVSMTPARYGPVRTADILPFAEPPRDEARRKGSPLPFPVQSARARIYRPGRSTTQAGKAGTKHWILEFEPSAEPELEFLMGWTASADTQGQVRLTFPDRESAVAFAERQGWQYTVVEPHDPMLRPRSYADNFRWKPPELAPEPAPDAVGLASVLSSPASDPPAWIWREPVQKAA